MDKPKIAFVSRRHTHYLDFLLRVNQEGTAEIAGVWDDDPTKAEDWAKRGGTKVIGSFEEILSDPTIDGVLITSTNYMHEHYICACAEAGKHVYVEQPLAVSVEAAERIRDAVKKSGIQFVLANPIKKGAASLAKKLAEQGDLGELLNVRVRTLHDNSVLYENGKFDDFGYVYNKAQSGGGAMNNMGCHGVKTLRWLLGMPESCVGMYESMSTPGIKNDIDENDVLIYKYASGAIGTVETGWVHPRLSTAFECHGTKGSVVCPGVGLGTWYNIGKGWVEAKPEDYPKPNQHPVPYWIEHIKYNLPETEYGVDEAVDLVKMTQAAYSSRGREVRL